MRIGIIGAGLVAQGVARLAVEAGHQVMLSNARGPHTLADVRDGIGCETGTVDEAAAYGESVLVAIPLEHYRTVPVAPLAGKLVMDADNYYPERDGHIEALDRRETTTSELLARHLPRSHVVKAFNAILAKDLAKGAPLPASGRRRALPIAGDDAGAKAKVATLVEQLGFDCLDAGPLADSWRFERAKPAYCTPLDRDGLVEALAAAKRDVDQPDGSWRN